MSVETETESAPQGARNHDRIKKGLQGGSASLALVCATSQEKSHEITSAGFKVEQHRLGELPGEVRNV
jgi:hypothetical protein